MTETPASALSRIGWRGEIPASDSGTDHRRIARVVAQHRAGYELHDGEHAFTAQPAPRFLKPGIDPGDRPAVGDFVWISNAVPPTIEQVLPRRSTLSRSAAGERHLRQVIATNIDTVMVVCGLDGDFNPARIERYFVLIEGSGAKAVVVLTKADLAADAQALTDQLKARMPAGTEIHAINAKTGFGVGKSTLTNTLLGEARQSTQAVRANDSRGRHTTTYRSLIMLPSGGCLIDTPGMREVKLTGDESFDGGQFDDIEELAGECRFGDCSPLAEPSCAVRAALDDGRLDPERWHSYLKLRDELAAAAESLEAQLRRKSESRVLTKALGKRLDEKYGRH